jgi:hypothetical protein
MIGSRIRKFCGASYNARCKTIFYLLAINPYNVKTKNFPAKKARQLLDKSDARAEYF